MLEEGATNAQTGHFFFQNKPQSDNQGNNLYVQFSLEICNLYCNKKQTNIHVRLHQHDQLLRDTYFKYFSIFSLISKSGQVEKVEGQGLQLRTVHHVLFLGCPNPQDVCLKAWKFGSVITLILQAQPNNNLRSAEKWSQTTDGRDSFIGKSNCKIIKIRFSF